MAPLRQSDTDACPGALRLHAAADGLLARVRLPAGVLSGDQMHALRELAADCGDGRLELTSRANLQIRGVRAEAAETLATRLRAAGLLPSMTHDPVRNIAAPPLAPPALRALISRLDAAILADPELPRLPGKFLFAIGHVPLAADLAAVPARADIAADADIATPAGLAVPGAPSSFTIRFGGHDTGLTVAPDRVVETLIAAAHAFLAEREAQRGDGPAAWRLRELTDGPARVSARVSTALGLTPIPRASSSEALTPVEFLKPGGLVGAPEHGDLVGAPEPSDLLGAPEPSDQPSDLLGVLEQPGSPLVAVGALVPLGRLGPVPLKILEKAARLVITPWRGVLVTDLPPEEAAAWSDRLSAAGLALSPDSPWVGVTACAGRPGCARSHADVRADATAASVFVDGLPTHWVGCERACGSPAGRHVRVLATPHGYQVSHAGTSPGLPESGMAESGPPAPGLPAPGLPAPGLPAPGLPAPGLPAPGLPAPGLPAPGLPEPGLAGAGNSAGHFGNVGQGAAGETPVSDEPVPLSPASRELGDAVAAARRA
ncbi:precorrin-3B synthase [Actinoplanes sp. OR16]|uniref:precorrin-3B synthase n=1 Tax=Actinoplanes sp. OR16 TaxID=946334 RepID=UPI000F6D3CF3|nr:precorrin-3B synthase [Actinoplanes sp. OR16]BBH64009.1 precorrin-3B synthase [Actinoplanes sp. OR16]